LSKRPSQWPFVYGSASLIVIARRKAGRPTEDALHVGAHLPSRFIRERMQELGRNVPDETVAWFTLKDVGKVMVFDARPPFSLLKTIYTGPITNHVNFVNKLKGSFAYVITYSDILNQLLARIIRECGGKTNDD
jgi:hypothetical protein